MDPLAVEAIETIRDALGHRPGLRAVHTKGTWAQGTFAGAEGAAALSRAPFLSGEPVRALVRFSNGGADPEAHDGSRDGRGIAVKLFLADGSDTDLLGLTVPFFTSRTPEDFIELVRLSKRDPATGHPDMAKLGVFLEAHPETAASLQARFALGPPASYLTTVYNGIHAFRWVAADGSERFVRTRWIPEGGVEELADEDAKARDPHYLRSEAGERLARGPARFTLLARIAAAEDALTDPTAPWPEGRDAIAVGTLTLDRAIDSPEGPGDIHVFDPLRVCDGIEPSDDPVLHFRRKAYDVSARARLGALVS